MARTLIDMALTEKVREAGAADADLVELREVRRAISLEALTALADKARRRLGISMSRYDAQVYFDAFAARIYETSPFRTFDLGIGVKRFTCVRQGDGSWTVKFLDPALRDCVVTGRQSLYETIDDLQRHGWWADGDPHRMVGAGEDA